MNYFKILNNLKIIKSYILYEINSNENLLESNLENFKNILTTYKSLEYLILSKRYSDALNYLNAEIVRINKKIFEKPCNKKWDELIPTDNYNIKFCENCNKHVYNISNLEELNIRRKLRQCVAINTAQINMDEYVDSNYKSCRIQYNQDFELIGSLESTE